MVSPQHFHSNFITNYRLATIKGWKSDINCEFILKSVIPCHLECVIKVLWR